MADGVVSAWRHIYPHARDYGQPWGLVQPGEVVEGVQPPEPAFFEAVTAPAAAPAPAAPVSAAAAVPVPAPTVIPIGPPAR